MKQKLLAVLCALALCISLLPSAAALSGEERRAANRLRGLGLLDGPVSLSEAPTRAQTAELLARMTGEAIPSPEDAGAAVTANDCFTMLLEVFGYHEADGDFIHEDAALFARHIGLTTQDYTTGIFTQGDLCEVLSDSLTFPHRNGGSLLEYLLDQGMVSWAQAAGLGLLNEELTARQIYDRCSAAVFQLDCWKYNSKKPPEDTSSDSSASGFFLDENGIAVTNFHSIEYVVRAVATLVTGEQYEVTEVMYVNKKTDIAIIRISRTSLEGKTTPAFAHLELPETDDVRAGDIAYAVSNPLGAGLAISDSIISDPARPVDGYALPSILNTVSISQGSSGGALLNAYGEAIGITSGAYLYGNEMYLSVPLVPALETDLVFIETSLEVFFNDMPFLDLDK